MTYRVGIVCAAGVSSTFLAHGLRAAIADAGLATVELEPMAADRAVAAEVDLLLVAHHLRGAADELRAATAAPAVVLTTDDRATVIDEALGHITARATHPNPTERS
jgi:cellobiose PTS system EIIB component